MTMVCGLDLHRRQITFDALEMESGEVWRGRVWQPDRERFRRWLTRRRRRTRQRAAGGDRGGGLHRVALRGRGDRRGWVRGASGRAGRHAGGAGSQAARQDRSQRLPVVARAVAGRRLPESWIPPTVVLEWRERVRLYKTLVDQRSAWVQRIHAELFQHGVTLPEASIRWAPTRTRSKTTRSSESGRPAADPGRLRDDRRHRRRGRDR